MADCKIKYNINVMQQCSIVLKKAGIYIPAFFNFKLEFEIKNYFKLPTMSSGFTH
jgi:hypothetical protein